MRAVVSRIEPADCAARREDGIIAQALAILHRRIKQGPLMDSPKTVRDYLTCHAAKSPDAELFTVMFLDSQHQLIECRDMFNGTLSQCSVYLRELARAALELNASAVILSHNHPSGSAAPSRADQDLTRRIKQVLELVDVRTLDHIITAGGESQSMSEIGLM